jgi:hypothetical protein
VVFAKARQAEQVAALPPASVHMELISSLPLNTPQQFRSVGTANQPLLPEQIADVAVYKDAAYLNSWNDPTCRRGGFFSVDISDPENPEQLAFVPALKETYHGEGAHVITLNIPDGFQGDVLAVNNEPCSNGDEGVGGFDLYDVSDPADPEILVQGAGDRSPDHAPGNPFASTTQDPQATPNSAHSIFIWQDGAKAYAVIVDNTELSDVDIFDITNPRAPVFITDVDLFELAIDEGIDIVDTSANGDNIFNHDMVVKEIDGVPTMLVSYWDAGYVKVDVSDPVNPSIIGDSDFGIEDPVMKQPGTDTGFVRPEGNGHQGEFSHDNNYVLAADEDFATNRFIGRINPGGAGAAQFSIWGVTVDENGDPYGPQISPTRSLAGDTRYVGDGCEDSETVIPPATPAQNITIAVVEPFGCAFQEKTETLEALGYKGVVIFSPSFDEFPDVSCNTLLNMVFENYDGNAVTLFVSREVGFRLMNLGQGFTCGEGDPEDTPTPAPGTVIEGVPLDVSAAFDGWGYMHLYNNEGDDLEAVDHFAIDEAKDPQYATGYGDLTVHEFAADPDENLAYSSYYAGGMRVMSFGTNGLSEVGKYLEEGGSNFWGVEVFKTQDNRKLIAGSDRDVGLYLFRYTGPRPPVCQDLTASTAFNTAVQVPLRCEDPDVGQTRTLQAVSQPTKGTVTIAGETATYTPNAGASGTDTFTYAADDGELTSSPATVAVTVAAPPAALPVAPPAPISAAGLKDGPCANDLLGTAARETLLGTSAGDRILGRAGNDIIRGNAGDDCILGEDGNDQLGGDDGNDDVDGGAGNDRVNGDDGEDDVAGGSGRDTVNGGGGDDTLTGGSSADKLSGGSGADRLDGGTGNDTAGGGSGNDRVSGGSGNDKLSGGSGRDTLRGGSGRDVINAKGGGRDRIDCGPGRDRVTADRNDRVARNCEVVRRR